MFLLLDYPQPLPFVPGFAVETPIEQVLKNMRRGYSVESYMKIIDRIKEVGACSVVLYWVRAWRVVTYHACVRVGCGCGCVVPWRLVLFGKSGIDSRRRVFFSIASVSRLSGL